MSSTTQTMDRPSTATPDAPGSWGLWFRQTTAILRLEIRKNFLGRRALLLYLMAAGPIVLLTFLTLLPPPDGDPNFNDVGIAYAAVYNGLILRTLVFFGCGWVFMNLFRGEVVDRSLHYYFLAPARREVLVVGKYLAGLLATTILFSITTVCTMVILYFWVFPSETLSFFTAGAGGGHLASYVGVTILACIGYGAVFQLLGLFFRNPIIPGIALYGWEWINFLLPPLLKKISVIHYLQSLVPVAMPEGPFAVLVEPTPAWISVPSLMLFTAVVLFLAGRYIRRMEISYAGD